MDEMWGGWLYWEGWGEQCFPITVCAMVYSVPGAPNQSHFNFNHIRDMRIMKKGSLLVTRDNCKKVYLPY